MAMYDTYHNDCKFAKNKKSFKNSETTISSHMKLHL